MFKQYYLCLDVGGTEIKVNVLNHEQVLFHTENIRYASRAQENKETILQNFKNIIAEQIRLMSVQGAELLGVGLAFPGPFDYEKGISLMLGIRKYDALYQTNLKDRLIEWLAELGIHQTVPIVFENDATSFAAGEYYYGVAKGKSKGMFITLGTGCGSTFIEDGRIVKSEYGLNRSGMIYDAPFLDGIIDEYISAKGLIDLAHKHHLLAEDGYQLYLAAERGNSRARTVLRKFGEQVGQALFPFVQSFEPNIIVFGGQISQSLKWMRDGIEEQLMKSDGEKQLICQTVDTSTATLKGLVKSLEMTTK